MQDVHEQHELEVLKAWWKQNGVSVLIGVALAIAGLAAWQGYQSYQQANAEAASIVYENLRIAQAQGKLAEVSREARQLMVDQPSSPYATGAAFLLAKQAVDSGDLEGAQADLRWVMQHGSDDYWQSVAAIRLARVLIEVNKPAEALTVLNSASAMMSSAFKGMADYVRGIALMKQGDQAAAQAAFKSAQENKDLATSMRSLAQLWVDDLAQETP
jgi:predicted negative regulator of RcsB-dependent stress response